jgi:predicted O-methyltransferase YrrM
MTDHDAVDLLLQHSTFGDDPYGGFLERSKSEGLPPIAVSPVYGRLLEILVRLVNASLIVEVGTLGGYSAAWMARAMAPAGRLVTLEIDLHHADVARANLDDAKLGANVDIRVGPALTSLDAMMGDTSINGLVDLSFIDADKANNPNYLDRLATLARPGGLIVVDNVVRSGGILDGASADPNIIGSRDVLAALGRHPRLVATAMQTVGIKGHDGFAIAYVAS